MRTFFSFLLLCQTPLTAAHQDPQGKISLLFQEYTVEVQPEKGKVSTKLSWQVQNSSPAPVRHITAYLTEEAEISDILSPSQPVSWARNPSLIPFFSSVRIKLSQPLGSQEKLQLVFNYTLKHIPGKTGLAAMNMSIGPSAVYLFECWYPTIEPLIDENTFIRKGQKAPFRMTVTVPDPFVGITIGKLLSSKKGSGKNTFRYQQKQPSPFLIPLFAAKLTKHSFQSGGDNGMPVPTEVFAPSHTKANRDFAGFVAGACRLQAKLLDRPVPEKLRIILMDTGGLARGFSSLIVLPPYFQSFRDDSSVQSTICHELSHTYFGNLVTAYGPGGNEFLSEGLATFMGIKTPGRMKGKEMESSLFQKELRQFLQSKTPQVPIVRIRPMQNVLSGLAYKKGALIFNELSRWVKEENLWKLLRIYLKKYEGKFACLSGFRSLAESRLPPETWTFHHPGLTLKDFFHQYLETTHLPFVKITGSRAKRADSNSTAERWKTKLTLENRGSGFALVPVVGSRSGSKSSVRVFSGNFFLEAKQKKTFCVETEKRAENWRIDPDSAFLHGARRESLLNTAKQLRKKGKTARAKEKYRELLDLLPEDGEAWYGLGRAQQQAGEYKAASASYRNAARSGNTQWLPTWAWLRGAECERRLGNRQKARRLLKRVLSEGSDIYNARKEARELLSGLKAD